MLSNFNYTGSLKSVLNFQRILEQRPIKWSHKQVDDGDGRNE